MPTLTIEVPVEVIDNYCAEFSYDENKLDGESRALFAKRMLIAQVREVCRKQRHIQLYAEILITAKTEADNLIIT